MKTLKNLLIELKACQEAVKWLADKSIEQAVTECPRGDWMLWLAAKLEIDHRKLTLAKGHCANTVRHLMKDERSIKAVDIAIAYGEGIATIEELRAAYAAAATYAAATYVAANADTAAATSAATSAADNAAANSAAASAATSAAASAAATYAAANSAAYAAANSAAYAVGARKQNMQETADICRKYIGKYIIAKVNKALK